MIIQIVHLFTNSANVCDDFVNQFIAASNSVKTLPKSFFYYSLPPFVCSSQDSSLDSGVVSSSMQTNFNKRTHSHTITGKFQLLSLLEDPTRNTSHCSAAPLRLWSRFPSVLSLGVRFLLFLREYFIYIQCFLHSLLSYRYRVVCIMFHFTHFSPWVDFSFKPCRWPASSRGIKHFSFFISPERISSGVVVLATCTSPFRKASYRRQQQQKVASVHFIQNFCFYCRKHTAKDIDHHLSKQRSRTCTRVTNQLLKNRWNGRELRANALKISSFVLFLGNNPLLAFRTSKSPPPEWQHCRPDSERFIICFELVQPQRTSPYFAPFGLKKWSKLVPTVVVGIQPG